MTARCDGCLGTTRCWVGLGTGAANAEARTGRCRSCSGSGHCAYCPEERRVLDLTDRRIDLEQPYDVKDRER